MELLIVSYAEDNIIILKSNKFGIKPLTINITERKHSERRYKL
jgi:hypothetical protein